MMNAEFEANFAEETAECFQIAQTDDFLSKMFPVPSHIVNRVMEALGIIESSQPPAAGSIHADGRWSAFPTDDNAKEDELYPAFIKVASRIAEEARKLVPDDEHRILSSVWRDYHTKSPMSTSTTAPRTRPRCLLALRSLEDEGDQDAIWWLRIIIAVEGRRKDQESWADVVRHLLGYLRQILVKQQNRRFVFGFTLGLGQISVWLQDRSGVLGTDVPIDFHKGPRQIVQIITALVYLPAHQLGFDPDMKLYLGPERNPLPPYRLVESPMDRMRSPHDTHWVITLSSTTYITTKAMSLIRSGEMRGSGTIVWVVMKYDERKKRSSERKLYALKQQWRKENEVSEADLYELAGTASDCIGKFIASEDSRIDGIVDSTLGPIRCGLDSVPPSLKRSRSEALPDERHEPHLLIHCTQNGAVIERFVVRDENRVINRIRTRILMSTIGHAITSFADRRELVGTILDAIKGDKYLYEHGVLPCDISPENIMIRGLEDNVPVTGGCIIDLDRGKRQTAAPDRSIPKFDDDLLETALTDVEDDLRKLRQRGRFPAIVDKEICRRALRAITRRVDPETLEGSSILDISLNAVKYIEQAISYKQHHRQAPPNLDYSINTLHWDVDLENRPVFTRSAIFRDHPDWSRSGTLPYISPELLGARPQVLVAGSIDTPPEDIYPDAVHDVEAFFWVLVYICVTRSGPGGRRREEFLKKPDDVLDPDQRRAVEYVHEVTANYFDNDDASLHLKYKGELHKKGLPEFQRLIFPAFHRYFWPFKRSLEALFQLLQLAYRYRGYEYCSIHDRAIEILADLLEMLAAPEFDESATPANVKELEERADFFPKLQNSIDRPPPVKRDDPTSPKVSTFNRNQSSAPSQLSVPTDAAATHAQKKQKRSGDY